MPHRPQHTATVTYGEKTATTTYKVTVSGAELDAVTQTTSRAFTAAFTSDASEKYTKDDFTVASEDGSKVLSVKSVEYSADGKSATVTLYSDFTDGVTYNVTCGDVTKTLDASVGAVDHIVINTVTAQQNNPTPIEFTLYDASDIDVTPSIDVDTTCIVSVTGTYSEFNDGKASEAAITMNTIGDTAEVTVTYNSNESDAKDVLATVTVECVSAEAVVGTPMFMKTTTINENSGCAKFYLGSTDNVVTVAVDDTTDSVYFCATDEDGNAISYDEYKIESANEECADADISKESGKYAVFTVTGNATGSTQLNITATKNGASYGYTIPVTVTSTSAAASMSVSISRTTMSNVEDSEYYATISASLYDSEGNWVEGSFTYDIETTANEGIVLDSDTGKVTAAGADAKTYTIKITGSDNNNEAKTFVKRVTLTVKALPDEAYEDGGVNLNYKIETVVDGSVDAAKVDENPTYTGDDSITTRLYATYNGLFAGYVRYDSTDGITIGEENGEKETVTASESTELAYVETAVKFGTKYFAGTIGENAEGDELLIDYSNDTANKADSAYTVLDDDESGMSYGAVSVEDGVVVYTPTDSEYATIAKTGTYTISYKLYYANSTENTGLTFGGGTVPEGAKAEELTRTFTVSNSVVVPTVNVVSKTVDVLSEAYIVKNLTASVDMNNETSGFESINDKTVYDGNYEQITLEGNKATVKYVVVEDTYGGVTWNFYVPVNATFKTE